MPHRPIVLAALLALTVLALACDGERLVQTCSTDSDCGADRVCRMGACEPADPVEPVDPGECDASCGEACGCVPTCASGVWCGPAAAEVCCAEGEVCGENGRCGVPVPTCDEGTWEPLLETCVGAVETHTCTQPSHHAYQPEVLWHFEAMDGFDQAISAPMVIDVTGDGVAEVFATFYRGSEYDDVAVMRALDGLDGTELWRTPADLSPTPLATTHLAVARFYENGPLTLITLQSDFTLGAFDASTGARLWTSQEICPMGWGAPSIVNLDGWGPPEIVCGFSVFDANGVRLWQAEVTGAGPLGAVVAVGDLDGDGRPDLTDGIRAYRHDGILLWKRSEKSGALAAIGDFMTDVTNLELDGAPEVVVVHDGMIELVDGLTGRTLVEKRMLPAIDGSTCVIRNELPRGSGGPPAIVDINQDGVTDVVIASGQCLSALTVISWAGTAWWQPLWSQRAIDGSSSVTSAGAFDLDGDGYPEVVYADETKLHFRESILGKAIAGPLPHCSGTLYELPIVADVDGDGSANVVVASNTSEAASLHCDASVRPGITVYREQRNRWANARPLWNQHAYSPTGILDDGTVPSEIVDPFVGERNVVRVNSHGRYPPLGIPDLQITHARSPEGACADRVVHLRIANTGEAPSRAGTPVTARLGGLLVGKTRVELPLRPGEARTLSIPLGAAVREEEEVTLQVGPPPGQLECDGGNNTYALALTACE